VSRLVVDASVAIKWYVPEVYSQPAVKLLARQSAGDVSLHVPDLFFSEFGNIMWKKMRLGEFGIEVAQGIVEALTRVFKTAHRSESFLPSAVDLAHATGRTVYDSVYLALAALLDCELVTADGKLYRGLQDTPWSSLLIWVEDI
jgi:predicted nucleic acid-binding protein